MALASRLLPLLAAVAATGFATAQKTPDEALQALREGNQRFAADRSLAQPLGEGVRRTLARGQSPFAVVLCCADSRVPPEHVFNCGLGELFVVRVAGHCADAETVASVEYAVEHLGASLCVVLGHEQCDAVAATAAQVDQPGRDGEHGRAAQQLLEHIEPAVRKAKLRELGGKSLLDACEEEHAQATVQDCFRRSALLRRYAGVGRFRMVAARYHLQSGEVEWLPSRPLPAEERAEDTVQVQPPAGVPPHVALRMLQAGHRRFLGDGKATADLGAARREALTHGQQPLAIVLTCADSRTAPEHVFDSGLGELLVVRIAGNVLNDDALASVEFAAGQLGASLLVVMGHSKCGAVHAAAQKPEGQDISPNLRALLARLEPSVLKARAEAKGRDVEELAVRGNALRAVHEARSRSAVLRRLEDDGRFAMLACVYDIASGDLEWLKDTAETTARPESEPAPAATTAAPTAPAATTAAPIAPAAAPTPSATPPATHEEPAPTNTAPDLPPHDMMPPAPVAETKPRTPHAAPAAPHAPESHDAHAAREPEPAPASSRPWGVPAMWRDPIVLAGITGVASLLIAAVLATKRR